MTLPWPDVPTSLFSTSAGTSRFAVNLSWFRGRPKEVYAFKRGYREAATRLTETVRASSDNRLPDFFVWPIVWLWRHHLELALKEVIACGEKLESEGQWTWPTGLRHDFKKMWTRAQPLIESLNHEPTASSTEMANLAQVIAEFDLLDEGGMGMRYPDPGPGGTEHYLDVVAFDEAMQRIANFLDAIHSEQERRLDQLNERLGIEYQMQENEHDDDPLREEDSPGDDS
jgi:hypothetical protein